MPQPVQQPKLRRQTYAPLDIRVNQEQEGSCSPVYPSDCKTNTTVEEATREFHHGGIDRHEGSHLAHTRYDGRHDSAYK